MAVPTVAPEEQGLVPVQAGPFLIPQILDKRNNPRLSIVLPTFNEARNIRGIIGELTMLLDARSLLSYEIIVVDDNSPDGTWQIALHCRTQHPQVQVIRRVGERGLSTAVIRGWQVATGDFLAVLDADLQHPPEIICQLLDEVERGADLAVGSRHITGGGVSDWSIRRRVLSRGAQVIGLALLPEVVGRLSDPMSGCFVVRRGNLTAHAYPAGASRP